MYFPNDSVHNIILYNVYIYDYMRHEYLYSSERLPLT